MEEAVKIVRSKGHPRALDMGTGSGVIGIHLLKTGPGSVVCTDISPGALAVARKNARAFGLQTGIEFLASDLFSAIKKGRTFDLICANLPYVALHEWEGLMAEVREFEPPHACGRGYGNGVSTRGAWRRSATISVRTAPSFARSGVRTRQSFWARFWKRQVLRSRCCATLRVGRG